MKKICITCMSVLALTTAFTGNLFAQQKVKVKANVKSYVKADAKADKDDDEDWSWGNNRVPGTWDASLENDQINIQFYGKHWSNGRNFPAAEFGKLPEGNVGEFSLTRESGKITFKGVFEGRFGHGSYTFDENAEFKAYLSQKGYTGLDNAFMMNVFFTDVNKGYFDVLKTNGYPSISNAQFKDLVEQNMNQKLLAKYFDLIKTEGYGHQSLEKLVELREHGVRPGFIRNFQQMGYKKISLDQALNLRDHGVTPAYVNELKKMGYPDMTLNKAQDLRDHGVSSSYLASLHNLGYKNITLDRAQELRDHGVSADFLARMHDIGYKLSLEKAQELRDHGVTPDFIKGVHALGFKDLSLEKAQELREHGVSLAYMQRVKSKNLSNITTLDDYIKLKDTGF